MNYSTEALPLTGDPDCVPINAAPISSEIATGVQLMSQTSFSRTSSRPDPENPERARDDRRLARILAGDEAAFGEIYEEYFPRV